MSFASSSCGPCAESSKSGINNDYECLLCDERFRSLHAFLRHRETHYERYSKKYMCATSKQQFSCRQQLAEHITNHPGWSGIVHDAESDDDGINHNDRNHPNKRRLKCTDCDATFQHWHQLLNHRTEYRGGIGRHAVPWEIDPSITPPWIEVQEDGSETINPPLRAVYQEYLPTITAGHDNGHVWGISNFPVNNFNGESENLFHHLNHIYETENTTFRINLAFGVILRNEETGQYRYYLPCYNRGLLR